VLDILQTVFYIHWPLIASSEVLCRIHFLWQCCRPFWCDIIFVIVNKIVCLYSVNLLQSRGGLSRALDEGETL